MFTSGRPFIVIEIVYSIVNSKSMIPNLTAAADPFVTAGGNSLDRVQLTLLTL